MNDLPKGWVSASLSDLGHWVGGGTPSKRQTEYWRNGTIPWVSPKDMKTELIAAAQDLITETALRSSATHLIRSGSVLVVVRSGILQHSLPVAVNVVDVALNQDLKALTPYQQINPRYLAWALRRYESEILHECSKEGTTVQSIEFPALLAFRIPLAPVAEQRRIVAAIEEHLSRLYAAVAGLERVRAQLPRYRAAVLKSTLKIDDALDRLPRDWRKVRVGDVADVFVGATPSRKQARYWGGGIPWVSSGEVAFCRIRATRESITEEGLTNSSARVHPKGTVLLGMIGEGRTRGQVAILDVEAAHNQNSAAIRVRPDAVSTEYLYHALEGMYESNRRLSSGNNQPALNKQRVSDILLSLPSIDVQRELITFVEAASTTITAAERAVEVASQRAQRFRQSILRRAFSGQLVPQDPSDESATVLLVRIRAERTAVPTRSRSRGPRKATR